MAAVSAITTSLMLLLHARGFGSIGGPVPSSTPNRSANSLDLDRPERALGWLYIGTVEPDRPTRRRQAPDVGDRLKIFSPVEECRHPGASPTP